MARRAQCSLLLLAVCAVAEPCLAAAQASAAANNTLLELLKKTFSTEGADELVLQGDLPLRRMPPNALSGWAMCDYGCMQNFNSSVRTGNKTAGVMDVDVIYKPLPGVTSEMMVWLFRSLHKYVRYIDAAGAGYVFPMYLLFHPVDHLYHAVSTAPDVRPGSVLTWCEIPLSGCSYRRASATAPWLCPAARSGHLRTDSPAAWQTKLDTKAVMVVTHFNASMMQFVATHSNPTFGGNNSRTVATTRHTWRDGDDGLQLRTQQWLGLMARGSHTQYEVGLVARTANGLIRQQYLGNATNVPAGNMTAAAHMASLHYLQEYGGLPHWLPAVYSSRALDA